MVVLNVPIEGGDDMDFGEVDCCRGAWPEERRPRPLRWQQARALRQ